MTEQVPAKETRTTRLRFGRIILWTVISVFVLLILPPFPIDLLLQFGALLFFGWFDYLRQVLPRVTFNPEIALDATIALALAMFGLHRILRWWTRKQRGEAAGWRVGWTAKITAMALLLFATSIAATGIVHQIGWLFRAEKLVFDRGRGMLTRELSNLQQIAVGLRLFSDEHGGKLPQSLNELVPDYLPGHSLFFSVMFPDEPPEQILYFPEDRAPNPQETIVVAGPRATGTGKRGKRAVAKRDGSGIVVSESEFQELMLKQHLASRTEVTVP